MTKLNYHRHTCEVRTVYFVRIEAAGRISNYLFALLSALKCRTRISLCVIQAIEWTKKEVCFYRVHLFQIETIK